MVSEAALIDAMQASCIGRATAERCAAHLFATHGAISKGGAEGEGKERIQGSKGESGGETNQTVVGGGDAATLWLKLLEAKLEAADHERNWQVHQLEAKLAAADGERKEQLRQLEDKLDHLVAALSGATHPLDRTTSGLRRKVMVMKKRHSASPATLQHEAVSARAQLTTEAVLVGDAEWPATALSRTALPRRCRRAPHTMGAADRSGRAPSHPPSVTLPSARS
jgi:hypothetical protein